MKHRDQQREDRVGPRGPHLHDRPIPVVEAPEPRAAETGQPRVHATPIYGCHADALRRLTLEFSGPRSGPAARFRQATRASEHRENDRLVLHRGLRIAARPMPFRQPSPVVQRLRWYRVTVQDATADRSGDPGRMPHR
jgi:hypothetical protein